MPALVLSYLPQPTLRPTPAALPAPPAATPYLAVRWAGELGESIQAVAWLPDHSAVLALTAAGRVVRLQAADGQPTWGHEAPGNGAVCLGVCPCGALAATGHLDGTLRLRQTATGNSLNTVVLGPAWVEHVRWSPDGQWLAASSGRVLHLLDGTGRLLGSYAHPHTLDSLSWQPDSRGLAVVSGALVQLWALKSEAPALEPGLAPTSGLPVSALAWAPDGRDLATGLPKGRVSVWQLPAGRIASRRRVVGRLAPVQTLSWHGNGRWLAAAHGPNVAVWAAEAAGLRPVPQLLTDHSLPVRQVAFQPHGSLLVSADAGGTLALWQPAREAAPLLGRHPLGSAATALHWMANGCCLAVGTASGRLVVFSVLP